VVSLGRTPQTTGSVVSRRSLPCLPVLCRSTGKDAEVGKVSEPNCWNPAVSYRSRGGWGHSIWRESYCCQYNLAVIRSIGFYRWKGLRVYLVGAAWLPLWVAAGCAVPAEVRLFQPQLVGRQKEIHLTTEQVCWAASETKEGQDRVLAEFPLPMARTGRPMYLLYLRVPAGKKKAAARATLSSQPASHPAAATQPEQEALPRVQGFLIQTHGEFAGLATVAGGTVVVSGTSQAKNAKRDLQLNLTCEDGSRIIGRLRARRDDYHVRHFETRRRPLDVEALTAGNTDATTD